MILAGLDAVAVAAGIGGRRAAVELAEPGGRPLQGLELAAPVEPRPRVDVATGIEAMLAAALAHLAAPRIGNRGNQEPVEPRPGGRGYGIEDILAAVLAGLDAVWSWASTARTAHASRTSSPPSWPSPVASAASGGRGRLRCGG